MRTLLLILGVAVIGAITCVAVYYAIYLPSLEPHRDDDEPDEPDEE